MDEGLVAEQKVRMAYIYLWYTLSDNSHYQFNVSMLSVMEPILTHKYKKLIYYHLKLHKLNYSKSTTVTITIQ